MSIPVITDPLGKHWTQPRLDCIAVDDEIALMTFKEFNELADYSSSIPSGVYEGKMWKAKRDGQWHLKWYDAHPTDPKLMSIHTRLIVLL